MFGQKGARTALALTSLSSSLACRASPTFVRFASSLQALSRRAQARKEGPNDKLWGVWPVQLAFDGQKRKIFSLALLDSEFESERLRGIRERAAKVGVPVHRHSRDELAKMTNGNPHQGVVAHVSERRPVELPGRAFQVSKPELWLALDGVEDPMNLGAILRSAYFFGVDRFITNSRGSAPLSSVTSKASAGVLELMDVYGVRSFSRLLREAKENDFDVVVAMAHKLEAGLPSEVSLDQTSVLLVLGNEGSGVRESAVSHDLSLNVSAAAAVLLDHITSKRRHET